MILANKLKNYRKQAGFSQTAVAEELNISRQSISKWENGRGYPDIDNLVLLSNMYEVSIDELLKENEELKKKIDINKHEISAKRRTLKFIKSTRKNDNDEGLVLIIIAAISALLFPLSFIIIPIVMLRNNNKNSLYKFVYAICILSLLINFSSAYDYFGTLFGWGEVRIEQID